MIFTKISNGRHRVFAAGGYCPGCPGNAAYLSDGIYMPVNRAQSQAHLHSKRIYCPAHISGQQFHQSEDFRELGLVHIKQQSFTGPLR